MPRPGPRRAPKTVRLSESEIAAVQKIANREHCEWSEAARLLMAYAAPRLPFNWKPKETE